jgi:hypothetical protein
LPRFIVHQPGLNVPEIMVGSAWGLPRTSEQF